MQRLPRNNDKKFIGMLLVAPVLLSLVGAVMWYQREGILDGTTPANVALVTFQDFRLANYIDRTSQHSITVHYGILHGTVEQVMLVPSNHVPIRVGEDFSFLLDDYSSRQYAQMQALLRDAQPPATLRIEFGVMDGSGEALLAESLGVDRHKMEKDVYSIAIVRGSDQTMVLTRQMVAAQTNTALSLIWGFVVWIFWVCCMRWYRLRKADRDMNQTP